MNWKRNTPYSNNQREHHDARKQKITELLYAHPAGAVFNVFPISRPSTMRLTSNLNPARIRFIGYNLGVVR
jgi:hypothetical protein